MSRIAVFGIALTGIVLSVAILAAPSPAVAQRVLILDDSTAQREAQAAAERLGLEARTESNAGSFQSAFGDGSEWDMLIVDVSGGGFASTVTEIVRNHLDAGKPFIGNYWNLDSDRALRDVLEVELVRSINYEPVYTTSGASIDLFSALEEFPSPITGRDRWGDNGDVVRPAGDGEILAHFSRPDGDPAIVTTRDGLAMWNGFLIDDFRGTDNDRDGVNDSVELLQNEIAFMLGRVRPKLLVYTDVTSDLTARFAEETETDAVVLEGLGELDSTLADTDFLGAYIELAAIPEDIGPLTDALEQLIAADIPVFFFSPDLDASPALAEWFDVTVGDSVDEARAVVPGPAGRERILFRRPNEIDGLAVASDSEGDSGDSITDVGENLALGRAVSSDGPLALAGNGDFILGTFLLSELGGPVEEGEISRTTAFLLNGLDFFDSFGPSALIFSDAEANGLESDLAAGASAGSFLPVVETSIEDFLLALDVFSPAVVGLELTGDGAAYETDAFIDAIEAWLGDDNPLVVFAADLDAMPRLSATLDVTTGESLETTRAVRKRDSHLGRLFLQPRATPSPLTNNPLDLEDVGDELIPDTGGIAATFGSSDAAAIAITRNGRAVVNGFLPQSVGQTDEDGDDIMDIHQLVAAEIHGAISPQAVLLLDDSAEAGDSLLAAAATRAGLRVEAVGEAAAFTEAFDAGTYQQLAIDSSETDLIADAEVMSRLDAWFADGNGAVVVYTNFDDQPDVASLFNLEVVDLETLERIQPSSGDPSEIFESPNIVPAPLFPADTLLPDPGDELTLTEGGLVAARYRFSFGPGATVFTRDERAAVNGFSPRELAEDDLDEDGVLDVEEFFINQFDRVGRAPVANAGGPYEMEEGTTLELTSEGSFDPSGGALTYRWDLDGDGEFDDATGPSPSIGGETVDGPDTLMVGLLVETETGRQDTDIAVVEVQNVAPTVDAGGDRTVDQGTTISFGITATDVPGDTLGFLWDFGDGTTSTEMEPSHLYDEVGVYDVTLLVTDDDGAEVTIEFTITYQNVAPSIDIGRNITAEEGDELSFEATVSDPGEDDLTVTWDFADGSEARTGTTVTHAFGDNATYLVEATAVDEHGGERTDSISVIVSNVPPRIVSDPPREGAEGTEYAYDVEVEDPGFLDELTYTLIDGPERMTINEDGQLRWTPGDTGFGDIPIAISVEDDDGGRAEQEWTIFVAFTDSDGGGAPDACEMSFGFDIDDPSDDENDPDEDGLTVAEECIAGSDPTVFSGPAAPELLSPIGRVGWPDEEIVLTIENSEDPDGDDLVYDFELYDDEELTSLVFEIIDVDEDAEGQTETTVAGTGRFVEDVIYFWRARAKDPRVSGPWSEPETFVYNVVNNPPGRPSIVSPPNNGIATTNPPTLRAGNADDPEGESLLYSFELYEGLIPDPATLVFTAEDVPEGDGGETAIEVDVELREDVQYLWRVRARDVERLGPFAIGRFSVDLSNSAPTAPVITQPTEEDTILAGSSITFGWENSEDADGDRVTYNLDIAVDDSFDAIVWSNPDPIAAAAGGETQRIVSFEAEAGITYHWRVAATDGFSLSDYDTASFTPIAPEENTPPQAPQPIAPAIGQTVEEDGGTIELIVDNAFDPDEDQTLTYSFQIARNVNMTDRIYDETRLPEGEDVTSVVVAVPTGNFFWRARANDGIANSPWSEVIGFTVVTGSVDPPDAGADAGADIGVPDVGTGDTDLPTIDVGQFGEVGGVRGGGCAATDRSVGSPSAWILVCIVGVIGVLRRRRSAG